MMRKKIVERKIDNFRKKWGHGYLYLAYHVAFPMSLTIDLVYRIWANFKQDSQGNPLNIPWIAVADLLISPLCHKVGEGDELIEKSLFASQELTIEEWNKKYNQPFYFGQTITSDLANYRGSQIYADEPEGVYREQTTPVGMFPPNAFGLYDMHGNVWEWCEDNWQDNLENVPSDGTAWKDKNSSRNVMRGGSWYYKPQNCRSAYRNYNNARDNDTYIGFRVVCVFGRTS